MSLPRFYTSQALEEHSMVALTPTQCYQILHVMRMQSEAPLLLFNGIQGLWRGKIFIKKYLVFVKDLFCIQSQPGETSSLSLGFSPVKRQGFLLEKATELGIKHFIPFTSQHSHLREINRTRYMTLFQETCEQSHQLQLPTLDPILSLEQILQKGLWWVLEPHDTPPLGLKLFKSFPIPTGILVGPEGGWSDEERDLFKASANVHRVNLGDAILRCETAAIVGIALAKLLRGDR